MIYLFGCSHTYNLYKNYFKDDSSFINYSVTGNSNQKIIHDVYTTINSPQFDKSIDVIIIQYTYTNRWWRSNVLPVHKLGFHSLNSKSPIFNNPLNKPFSKELKSFYETFLKFFWDYYPSFNQHIMEVDMLKSYMDSNNIKYIHYMFSSGGNTDEWIELSIEKKNKDDLINLDNYNLNCLKIDGYDFIEDWAKINGYLDRSNHIDIKYQDKHRDFIINNLKYKFGDNVFTKNII